MAQGGEDPVTSLPVQRSRHYRTERGRGSCQLIVKAVSVERARTMLVTSRVNSVKPLFEAAATAPRSLTGRDNGSWKDWLPSAPIPAARIDSEL